MLNANQLPALREIIAIQRKLTPLTDQFERLKSTVRQFGPGDYPVEHEGVVKISEPVRSVPKETILVVDPEKLEAIDPKTKAALFTLGVIRAETIFTQARASSVTVRPS